MISEARRKESIIHLMERTMRSLLWAFRAQWRPAVIMFIILALMTGVAYPLLVTGAAQALFPHQANGSAIVQNGKVVGSELIGQPFSDPRYFWGRPSATPSFEYNSSLSGGTNYATDNPALEEMVQARIDALHASDPNNTQPIPSDLVTASASGLDPHISVASAYYQLSRVARDRNMSEEVVQLLIEVNTDDRQLGILGESTVNVLELNLALYKLYTSSQGTSVMMEQAPDERVLGMTTADWLFLASLLLLLGLGALATGRLLAEVYDEGKGKITQAIERVESYLYRPARIGNEGMTWKMYAF